MGAKNFSHTHRSTMYGLKKLASGGFPRKLKSVVRTAAAETVETAAEMDQKQYVPRLPGVT